MILKCFKKSILVPHIGLLYNAVTVNTIDCGVSLNSSCNSDFFPKSYVFASRNLDFFSHRILSIHLTILNFFFSLTFLTLFVINPFAHEMRCPLK